MVRYRNDCSSAAFVANRNSSLPRSECNRWGSQWWLSSLPPRQAPPRQSPSNFAMTRTVIMAISSLRRPVKRSRTIGARSMRRSFRRFAPFRAECHRHVGRRTRRGSAHPWLRQIPHSSLSRLVGLERSPLAKRLCGRAHRPDQIAAISALAAFRSAAPGRSCSFVSSWPAQSPVLAAHMWWAPRGLSMGPLSTRARPYLPLSATLTNSSPYPKLAGQTTYC